MLDLFTQTETGLSNTEQQALSTYEATIATGLQTFVEVGTALLAIRVERLYRAQYETFDTYCRERWGFSDEYARLSINGARVVGNLMANPTMVGFLPQSERVVRPLTRLEPDQQREAWKQAVDTAPNGKITAAHVQATVDAMRTPARVGKPESLHISDDSYEWFTPPEYIEAARTVMGRIDTDPASCPEANKIVQAETFYTADDDGLAYPWPGNVWLNPPYNMPWVERFIDKAIAEYDAGRASAVLVLTNNSTDTGWFHKLFTRCPTCFTRGRIRFLGAGGEILATRQGQAIFYLGRDKATFVREFSQFGIVVEVVIDDQQP